MRIKTRVFMGFSSIAIITLFMGIFTYYTYFDLVEISEYHSYVELPAINTISEIKGKLFESQSDALQYIISGDDSEKNEYLQTKYEMNLLITTYESIINTKSHGEHTFLANAEIDETRQNNVSDIKKAASELYSLIDKMHALGKLGQTPYEIEETIKLVEKQEHIFSESVNLANQMEFNGVLQKQNELDKITQNFMTYSITFIGFLIASIFGIGFLISNSISKPLQVLENSIKKTISEGLQEPLPIKGDEEIKSIIHSFNELATAFKELDLLKDKEFQSIKDMTDLKHALDSSAIVTITDTEGTITYVNDKFCKTSKYLKEELLGQNHRLLKSGYHTSEFYRKMWRDISSGFVWRGDIKNRAKDDSYYWVRTVIVPILDKKEKPYQYIAIRYDITNQKETEEKLNEVFLQLKKNDKLKDEFASMVTHELKTPLTPIMGYCEMLRIPNLMGTLNSDQLHSIKEIEDNAKRLKVLIGDVLDAQKLDMNQMIFAKSKISTDEFMKNVSENVSFMMNNKNIDFVNKTEKYSIITDKNRLAQVMHNLISNAVDFVPNKNGKIEIGTKKEDSEIIFYVKDNGIGISKDKQDELFRKFYQVDTSAKRQHGGTGLGLAICKGIVEGLGGKIWVESDLGQGTTVCFSLPESDDK